MKGYDFISRAELLAHLDACLAESDRQTPITDAVLTAIKCAVEQMPTVEPTPTRSQFKRMAIQLGYELVVRCYECKRRGTNNCPMHIVGTPADEELLLKLDNDFCSYGERRNDD